MPALIRSRSAAQWVALPTPAEAKVNVPGLALAAATSSLQRLDALGGRHHRHIRHAAERGDRGEIVCGVVGDLGIGGRRRRMRGGVDQQRISIRIRLADGGSTNRATGAAAVLNNDRLPELG